MPDAEGQTAMDELRGIVARLRAPDGCPWDREQTHDSLRGGLIEEAYEVIEAIDRGNDAELSDELGDLLLQTVMHAQIASEAHRFNFDDVARGVTNKLIRRHPHVFGENKLGTSGEVLKQWDEIKRTEKGAESVLDGVSRALPALMRAEKIQKRAARVGFDWPDAGGALEKLREEMDELEGAIAGENSAAIEDEVGDLLFTVVNLARKLGVDPELAMQRGTEKFAERFRRMEANAPNLQELNLEQLEALWQRAKSG
jgi:MazG family protein